MYIFFLFLFQAHEDFVLLVGKAYLLVLVMKIFEMGNIDDSPKHTLLKNNMKYLQNKDKEIIFDALMEEILDSSLMHFELNEQVSTTCNFYAKYTFEFKYRGIKMVSKFYTFGYLFLLS